MSFKSFLLADQLHINPKNFGSLYEFCGPRAVGFVHPGGWPLPIDAFGNYGACRDRLGAEWGRLPHEDDQALFDCRCRGIRVFDVARAELLSLMCARPDWLGLAYEGQPKALFARMLASDRQTVLLNMAAAIRWIDHWAVETRRVPRLAYIGVFSGSLIYARALLEVAKEREGRMFVFESFFTGRHYYCEERFSPIPNRSDVRHDAVYDNIELPRSPAAIRDAQAAALQAFLNTKNKNVAQPPAVGGRLFAGDKPVVLVLGQVLNDFSLLEIDDVGVSSIHLYVRLVERLLRDSDFRIVFKAHPWERKKHNLRRPITKDFLADRFRGEDRFRIVEDYPLPDLFAEADCVFCINSQSGIEAALQGFKPFQVGRAFWGARGFSNDHAWTGIDACAQAMMSRTGWRLNVDEYDALLDWAVKLHRGWLVPEQGGEARLKQIFHDIGGLVPGKTQAVVAPAATPKTSTARPAAPQVARPVVAVPDSTGAQRWPLALKRFRKFRREPGRFFLDSRFRWLQGVGKFFLRVRHD